VSEPIIHTPGATPEEAAAVVAALERFLHDTATTEDTGQRAGVPLVSPWKRAALAEGVSRPPLPGRQPI
jgi:hypothetical protein